MRHWAFRWLWAAVGVLCAMSGARGLDPNTALAQYTRERWSEEQGFPGGRVNAIAQTPDGFLWIGTERGLVRFDGLTFASISSGNPENSPDGPVLGLVTDGEGNLWIRQEGPILLRYRDGKFENASRLLQKNEGSFTAMGLGIQGELLIAGLVSGPMRYSGDEFHKLTSEEGIPNVLAISMAQTNDRRIWIGTRDAGLFYGKADGTFGMIPGLPDKKVNCLLPSDGPELWIGTDNGVARWNGSVAVTAGLPASLAHAHVLAMLRDRESNIWIGSSSGVLRLNDSGVSSAYAEDKLWLDSATALFEDREGNLWIGTANGIERLRDREFTTYSMGDRASSEMSGPVYVDSTGRAWFAPAEGGLRWIEAGKINSVKDAALEGDVVYSIAGGPDGLWIGRQRGGLTHLRFENGAFKMETFTQAAGLAQNSVYAVYESRDGTVWAGTVSEGVSIYRNGRFTTYNTAGGLPSNSVTSILEAADGTMWLGTSNGLAALSKGQWKVYATRHGVPPGTVNCLFEDSSDVIWVGTSNGLAIIQSGNVRTPGEVPDALQGEILGIEQGRRGNLWIGTSNHVLRINRDKLFNGTTTDADVREYGPADGLQGSQVVKRHRSVVSDSRGRIWFSTSRGISYINPLRVSAISAPAIVHVESLTADGRKIELGSQVRVPVPPQRIMLSYSGLSLAVPGRVRFRYRLDGFDSDWSEPTGDREANYTNLGSGTYKFRVVASNSEGLWNSEEASTEFVIAPFVWQTLWFRIVSVSILGLGVLVFFRIRFLRVTQQMKMRFDERLAERTRIAQELHDTLLQGVLSASMQLHVADDRTPEDSPAKPILNRVLQLMTRVVEEGRNTLRGLRLAESPSQNLEDAFAGIREQLAISTQSGVRIFVEGESRELRQPIRDEVYFIGREALANAFRHSGASQVIVEVEYAAHHLRVVVRDNGCGIDPQILSAGRDGHWGLSGMRERAEHIGARLRVLSREAAGTEIDLTVPGRIAFEPDVSSRKEGWLSRFYLRKARGSKEEVIRERKK
jgi:ligand-binding sensor domain-containing protein/signal transduction histidine kinase